MEEIKEKIFELLSAKLGKTSLSERTVRSYAASMAAGVKSAEEITDSLIGGAVDILKVLEGQFNHDVKEQVEKQLESKAGGKGSGLTEEPKIPPEYLRMFEDYQKQMEEFAKFKKDFMDREKRDEENRKREELVRQVTKFLSDLGCSDAEMRELVVLRHGVDGSLSAEDNAKALKTKYDEVMSGRVKPSPLSVVEALASSPVATMSEEDRAKAAKEDIKKFRESGPAM